MSRNEVFDRFTDGMNPKGGVKTGEIFCLTAVENVGKSIYYPVSKSRLKELIKDGLPHVYHAFTMAEIHDMDKWVNTAVRELFIRRTMDNELADALRYHLWHLQTHGTWNWVPE